MFKEIGILNEPPRDSKKLKASFSEGLRAKTFFGYFFLLGMIFFILLCVFKFQLYGLAVGFLVIAGFAFLMIYTAKKKKEKRQDVYVNGSIVRAKVIDQGRSFNYFRSKPNYTVSVKFITETGKKKKYKIVHPHEHLWASAKLKQEIVGLEFENKFLFGQELGRQFFVELRDRV